MFGHPIVFYQQLDNAVVIWFIYFVSNGKCTHTNIYNIFDCQKWRTVIKWDKLHYMPHNADKVLEKEKNSHIQESILKQWGLLLNWLYSWNGSQKQKWSPNTCGNMRNNTPNVMTTDI